MTNSQSLLPKEGGGAVRRRRIGASGLLDKFGVPQGFAQLLPEEGACITALAIMLHYS